MSSAVVSERLSRWPWPKARRGYLPPPSLSLKLLPHEAAEPDSPSLARGFAERFVRADRRHDAEAWMLLHPRAAAIGLVPLVCGAHSALRNPAMSALVWLARVEGATVEEVARAYGTDARAIVTALLRDGPSDARDAFPAPAMPPWLDVATLPALRTHDGTVLPAEAVAVLLVLLALSNRGDPYLGLEDIAAELEVASRAALSWALFSAWEDDGGKRTWGWLMDQLIWLGGDAIVGDLLVRVEAMVGRLSARAEDAIGVLGQIGTDAALIGLDRFAHRVRSPALQRQAMDALAKAAARAGVTVDALPGSLIPSERALATGRAWPGDLWSRMVARDPQLAGRFVWQVVDGPRFRVGARSVAPDERVCLAHPLHMDAAEIARWTAEHGEQPFEQLARSCYRLEAGEAEAAALTRWDGLVVAVRRFRGMLDRGWRRGPLWDDQPGTLELRKPLSDGREISLYTQEIFDLALRWPTVVHLAKVRVGRGVWFDHAWASVSPVEVSELIRDLAWLTDAQAG